MDSKHSDDDYIINDTEYKEDEADIAFDKQEKSKKKGSVIRRIILIICIIVFCVSAGMLIKILLEYKKGSDIYKDVQSEVLDDNTPVTVVPSVNLRLPIVQGTDNEKYLETTIDGSINKNGCPFIDYRIKGGITASHVIIYGHTLYSGTMFSSLHKYRNSGFYSTEGNDKFYIYTQDKIKEYQIFSVYLTDPVSDTFTFNFPDIASMRQYAMQRKELTMYETTGDVSEATQIITLSTCADNLTKRLIIHGSYIGESVIP